MGFSVWSALQLLPDRAEYNGILYLVVGLLLQIVRWVGMAFLLGAAYAYLPTRLGPTKAAVLAAVWAAAALATDLIDRWHGEQSGLWLYTSLQMFVFLVVLAVLRDIATIHAAGGSWRRLNEVYRTTTWRRRVAYAGPLLLAVAGLVEQVRSGANTDLARQFIDSIGKALGAG